MDWQPIETAPKDGTLVDLFLTPPWAGEPYPESKMCVAPGIRIAIPAGNAVRGFRFVDAFFCPVHKCWRAKKDLHYAHQPEYEPTHWMLAPTPPA